MKTKVLKDSDSAEDLQFHTRKVINFPYDPARHIVEHFEVLKSSKLKDNTGKWFEYCFVDALVTFKDPDTGNRIDSTRIVTNFDANPPFHLDTDILVCPSEGETRGPIGKRPAYFLYLKTSFRERWKQFDRAAVLTRLIKRSEFARTEVFCPIGFLYQERPAQTVEKSIEYVKKTAASCLGVDDIITARDPIEMLSLFQRIASQ